MSLSVRPILLVGLALTCMAALPQGADAGTYEVGACTESVGYVNNSWHLFDSNSHYLEDKLACREEPSHELSAKLSNLAVGDVIGAGDPPVGVEAGWSFAAPFGATISEIKGLDDLFKDTDNSWEVALKNGNGEVLGGQTCFVELRSSFYCEVSGTFQASGIDTETVVIGVSCSENGFHDCPDGATIHNVRAELDYAIVTINDPAVPSSVISFQVPPGSQRGVVSILGSAVDDTAGLLSLSVVNSANEVVGGPVSVPGGCNYSFTTPCPTKAEDLAIPLDTTKLPNGQNQIRVEATNAAHDEGFSPAYTLDVENSLPKQEGGTGPPAEGGSGSGSKSGGSNQSGTSSGAGGPPSSASIMQKSQPLLPALSVKAKAARSLRGYVVVSGLVSKGATGFLNLTVHGTRESRHVWTYKAVASITNGRFSVRFRPPKAVNRHTIDIGLSYAGGVFFAATKVSLSIREQHHRIRR